MRYSIRPNAKLKLMLLPHFTNLNPILTIVGYNCVGSPISFLLPWDEMVKIYAKRFSDKLGAKTINPRIIIGSFVIKHNQTFR